MKWYPWLRPSFEHLISQHQAGRGHHALLIHAQPGMGDDALIYALGRWLMCQQPDGFKSCNVCRSCQLMQAGTHPDHYRIEPEKGKASLGIDAVRDVSEKLYEHARLGGAKVVWIADTALLTEAAANALLKTLEEPPENTWFLLGCHAPENLLPTLRSRCFYWHIPVPEERYAQAWLAREKSATPDELKAALRLSGGAPAAALTLLEDDARAARQQLCTALGDALSRRDFLALLAGLNHDSAAMRLYWLSTLLLDALKWQQGAARWLANADQQPLVEQLAAGLSLPQLQNFLHSLFRTREQLLRVAGVNRELLLTDLLLSWEQMLTSDAPRPTYHL